MTREKTIKVEAETLSEPAKHPELDIFLRQREAFMKMKNDLLKDSTYVGKFVAVYREEVVDFDEDNRKLARRVYDKFGYVPIYIGKVQQERSVGEMSSPERA